MALELLSEDDRIVVKDADLEDVSDPDKDATYTLRPLTTERQRELTKRHTTYTINKQKQTKEPKVDVAALADDLIDHVLIEWTGINAKGQPLPCERQYKLKLDLVRKNALVGWAGLNRSEREQQKTDSFRAPA